jgi:hypothetical protein
MQKKAVFVEFCDEFILFQTVIGKKDPHHFVKRTGSGTTHSTHQADQNIVLIEVLNLQIVEPLGSVFVCEEFDMLFNDRLVLLGYAQVHRKQGGAICKEPLRIQHSVFQMVFPHVRLWKWSVNQVVRVVSSLSRKNLVPNWLPGSNFRIFALASSTESISSQSCFIIVPKDELAGFTRKLSIQLFDYLIQI